MSETSHPNSTCKSATSRQSSEPGASWKSPSRTDRGTRTMPTWMRGSQNPGTTLRLSKTTSNRPSTPLQCSGSMTKEPTSSTSSTRTIISPTEVEESRVTSLSSRKIPNFSSPIRCFSASAAELIAKPKIHGRGGGVGRGFTDNRVPRGKVTTPHPEGNRSTRNRAARAVGRGNAASSIPAAQGPA